MPCLKLSPFRERLKASQNIGFTIGNFYGDDETLTELFDYSSSESEVCEYFIDEVAVVSTSFLTMINTAICEGEFYILPDGEIVFETTVLMTSSGNPGSLM